MLPAQRVMLGYRPAGGGGGPLDTQTVTNAQTGSAGSRVRGFVSGSQGSITDGTSNLFGGGAITEVNYDETTGSFRLAISGSTNTGWTTMTNTTDSKSLNRADASFSGGVWTWAGQAIAGFYSGTTGSKVIEFS